MTKKFCKDCTHYIETRVGLFNGCDHPDLAKQSVVTGEVRLAAPELARASGGECGPLGRLFSPKSEPKRGTPLPFFERLKFAIREFKRVV